MKAKHIIAATCALFVLGLSSCNEGLLDVERHGVISQDNFYKTDKDAEAALANVYQKGWTMYQSCLGEMFMIKNLLSDDHYAGGLQRNDQSLYENINEYTFEGSNRYLLTYFKDFYNMIYACNMIISKFDGENLDSDVKRSAVAQAKIWRAWSYMELITLWGTVPLVDHPLEASEYQQPNGDPQALWDLVINDLKQAIAEPALPKKTSQNDRIATVTQGFAQALLGKAYVYMTYSLAGGIKGGQDAINAVEAAKASPYWKNAAEELEKVISSNMYALYQGDFANLLNSKNDWSSENVYEWNRIYNASNTSTNLSTTMESFMIGWSNAQMTGYGETLPCNRASNFLTPRKSAYDEMVAWQGKDNPRMKGSIRSYDQVVEMGCGVISGVATIYACDGLFDMKYYRDEHKDCITSHATDRNYPLMRYAEVLLLAAEANLMCGQQAKADEYMNIVRERADLPRMSNVTLSDIQNEKRCELYGEGQRRYDIIRWGIAYEKMKDQGGLLPYFTGYTESAEYDASGKLVKLNSYGEGKISYQGKEYTLGVEQTRINESMEYGFHQGKHELLPFPQQEMLLSGVEVGGQLVQNPGW